MQKESQIKRLYLRLQVGLDLLKTAESALIELAALATRLREIGIADTVSSNSASDTAALNAEAIAVSDSASMILYLQQSFIIWQFYLLVQELCYS